MAAIVGRKLGMTRIFDEDGIAIPVTVVEAPPCVITALRNSDRDGYEAVQLAGIPTEERKLTKGELGHLKKAGAGPMRRVVEFRDAGLGGEGEEERKLGDQVTVGDFQAGEQVKVAAVSIGKGFQGSIKRHNFSRGPMTHGSHNIRAPGSIGASADPARVFKGMGMPGRMGGRRVTQRGATIVGVDAERNLLLIRGSVPGPRNATVEVHSDG